MSHFAAAVHIVTTDGSAGKRGVTVTAAASVSDDPATVLVCLNRNTQQNDWFVENGVFAVNTLAAHHRPLADAFSGLGGLHQDERFERALWDSISTGAPTLSDAVSVLDCTLLDAKDVATHRVLYGRVTGLRIGDNLQPLIYHGRAYHVL